MNLLNVSAYTNLMSIANDAGIFKAEIEPVTLTIRRKEVKIDTDEHPRPQTTLEGLQKLKPVFKKDGLVTAGSASVSHSLLELDFEIKELLLGPLTTLLDISKCYLVGTT